MTSPITSSTGSTDATSAATTTKTPAMDKDAFLKLLVAQMKNQDPLKPMEGTEFVTQLAQFTAVEQSLAQSQKLDMLSAQLTGIANNDATALVGKSVTVRGKQMAFDGTTATGASVTLSGAAASMKVTIRDANGAAVRTMDLGAKGAGVVPIAWDGRGDNGQVMPAGSYSVEIAATDKSGAPVSASQDVTGVVKSVAFDKGYPELLLASGARAPISDLVSVGGAPKTSP